MAEETFMVKAWGVGVNSIVRHNGKMGIIIRPPGEGVILMYADGEEEELGADARVVEVITGREAAFQYCKILARRNREVTTEQAEGPSVLNRAGWGGLQ
jgi:hypothetical protein